MNTAYMKVDDQGYQEMPSEAYQKWLKSIDQEKSRQANQVIKDRMKREIEMLKRTHSTLINKAKK
jgi:hypothetical protein